MEQRHVIGWVFVGRRVPRRGRLRERLEKRPEARAEHLPLTRPPRPLFPVTHHSPLQAQLPSLCDQPYGELIWREGGDPLLSTLPPANGVAGLRWTNMRVGRQCCWQRGHSSRCS